LRAYNAAKCDCDRGSALDPAGGAYSAPADPLAGFKGAALWRGEGYGGRGKGRVGEGTGRRGAGREGKGR